MARPAGSPNKPTQALRALLDKRFPGWSPVVQMAEIAQDAEQAIEVRLSAAKEVAKYIYPQLKAVDLADAAGNPAKLVIEWTSSA